MKRRVTLDGLVKSFYLEYITDSTASIDILVITSILSFSRGKEKHKEMASKPKD